MSVTESKLATRRQANVKQVQMRRQALLVTTVICALKPINAMEMANALVRIPLFVPRRTSVIMQVFAIRSQEFV